MTVNSGLIYSIIDVAGGRRSQTAVRVEAVLHRDRIQPRQAHDRGGVGQTPSLLSSRSRRQPNIDRMETNPRFAAISRPANAAILVRLRIDMEDRGGGSNLLLPYAAIDRSAFLPRCSWAKFGRDPI